MNNLFDRLFTYKPSSQRTSAENFITESFVHLLEYSAENRTNFIEEFLTLLELNLGIIDFGKIHINTQRSFKTTFGLYAIPDITIQYKETLILIEVKYYSTINTYEVESGSDIIDQIQKYQAIIKSNETKLYIFTLVQLSSNVNFKESNSDFGKELYWRDIHNLIAKHYTTDPIEKYLHKELKKFMEENYMATQKVTYELTNGMKSLLVLFNQIEQVLDELAIPYNKSFGYSWTGYYLFKDKDKSQGNISFIGTYWDGEKIIFEFNGEKAREYIITNKLEDQYILSDDLRNFYTEFNFEKQYFFCLEPAEQVDKLKLWVKENYDKLISMF